MMSSAPSIQLPSDCLNLEFPQPSDRLWDLTVEVVEEPDSFAALREEWNELLSASTSDCLFLTWEWLFTWWTHLSNGRRLFIVTVRSGRQLVAIAPLTVARVWVGPFAIPVLEFAGTGSVGSDYLDFIVRADCQTPAMAKLGSFLADTGLTLRLPCIKQDSCAAGVARALTHRAWECLEVPTEVCPYIDLTNESWDSYLNSLGPRHRYNFRRRLRNLERTYEVRFQQADSEEERREMLRHLVDLHLLCWQQRGGSSAFHHPSLIKFHDELTRLAHQRGWLRLFALRLNGAPVAASYGFRYGRTFYFYQSGFDPDFHRYSVGLVTMGLTIRRAIEQGTGEYDLLHGNETYKFLWATQVRQLVRLELYPPGFWGRMHSHLARVTGTVKHCAKRALQSIALPAAITTFD